MGSSPIVVSNSKEKIMTHDEIMESFDDVYEHIPIAIAYSNTNSQFIKVNKRFCTMTGYSKDEILGKKSTDLHIWHNSKEREHTAKTLIASGRVVEQPFTLQHKSGKLYYGLMSAEMITDSTFISFGSDITESTKLSTKYKTLFDNMPSGYNYHRMIYDRDGKPIDYEFLEQNAASINMLSNIIGKSYLDIFGKPNPDDFNFIDAFGKVVTNGKSIKLEEYFAETQRWYSVLAYTPKPDHFVAIFDDITDIKRKDDQLRQAAKLESIGLLAGGIAHDFNNILTIIRGYTELVVKKSEQGQCDKTYSVDRLRKVIDSADRARGLTKKLLAFGRRQILKPEAININDLITNEKETLISFIREDISMSYTFGDISNILADKHEIQNVIMNIVLNSRDAIEGRGHISFATENVTFKKDRNPIKAGDYVLLTITDDGIGMSKKTQGKIFEPFFTTKKVGKGTGLGLSTAYGIIKQSGGHILVYSTENIGTYFEIYFPVTKEKVREEEKYVLRSNLSGNETILVVEDEFDVRAMVAETLEVKGYNVIQAENGVEALKLIKNSDKPDILLTDVVMPEMDGKELSQKIVQIFPDIKIIYMSGYTDNTIVYDGILYPGINFIQKPVSQNDLVKMIRKELDKH